MHAETPKGEKSGGMEGLIKEGNHLLAGAEATVRDATLISVAQRIEHYEIASYGCVRTYAEQLGFERASQILQETLQEEEETDRKLTSIAKSRVNVAAARQSWLTVGPRFAVRSDGRLHPFAASERPGAGNLRVLAQSLITTEPSSWTSLFSLHV